MADVELFIKINKEKYDAIKSDLYNTFPAEMKEWGLEAIRNGTPLPKSHGKIVDANRVLENGDNWEVETALMQTESIIEADPTESEAT